MKIINRFGNDRLESVINLREVMGRLGHVPPERVSGDAGWPHGVLVDSRAARDAKGAIPVHGAGVSPVSVAGLLRLSGEDRDRIADERDERAEAQDRASDDRDARATARDERADVREHESVRSDLGAESDRARARSDRRRGATDRKHARDHRVAASRDRDCAARERATSLVDELTGAHRRDAGILDLDREVKRAARTNQSFALAFVDVDGLKSTNDTLGHLAGDEVLFEVVAGIRRHLRSYDLIVRYGGDEFLCGITDLGADEVARRFALVNAEIGATHHATITAGVAMLGGGDGLHDLIERADQAMYHQRAVRVAG